jgi:hypothetical protein
MDSIGLITGLLGLITLIVFFVMAIALSNISTNTKEIRRLLKNWADVNGYDNRFTCNKCGKDYIGSLPQCPHCKADKVYKAK